jgi:hypothetical protein
MQESLLNALGTPAVDAEESFDRLAARANANAPTPDSRARAASLIAAAEAAYAA